MVLVCGSRQGMVFSSCHREIQLMGFLVQSIFGEVPNRQASGLLLCGAMQFLQLFYTGFISYKIVVEV